MAYRPLYTASSAYAEARQRDPSHDYMQSMLLLWLNQQREEAHTHQFNVGHAEQPRGLNYRVGSAEAEHLFTVDDTLVGFADVAGFWHLDDDAPILDRPLGDPQNIYLFYEIKPDIASVGGLIRQLKMTERNAERTFERWRSPPLVGAVAVVKHNDPLLSLLLHTWEGGVLVWDGMLRDHTETHWPTDLEAFRELSPPRLESPRWPFRRE